MPKERTGSMGKDSSIKKRVDDLVRRFGTRDPFHLAKALGVTVMFRSDFKDLKGMYKVILRNRYIFLNGNLDPSMQWVVCAHELGHDLLHRRFLSSSMFKEFVLYDMKQKPEFEANVFAAELLLDDEVVVACFREGYDVFQVAGMLGVDVNLLLVKVHELFKRKGDFQPMGVPRGDFLGRI